IHVDPQSRAQLQAVARAFRLARRVVVVTGAGISTAAGIPDYRSKSGLYAKGDIFCAAALKNPQRVDTVRSAWNLYELAKNSLPTKSHEFVTVLNRMGKLVRCYTQNVDQLHERAGLSTGLEDDAQCVPLHGTVDSLRCPNCCQKFEWTEGQKEAVMASQELLCSRC
ncbi:DHS-like NAD/FAD-binding domain-containing protein, partial [Diplogelasinospora grovesii]